MLSISVWYVANPVTYFIPSPHPSVAVHVTNLICIQIYGCGITQECLFDDPTTACGFQCSRFDKFLLVCCREENRSNLRSFHHK